MEPEKPFLEIVTERRSTPAFDSSAVSADDLEQILRAGLLSPSSYNLQPWRLFVVRSDAGRKKLRVACYNQGKVEEASTVIVACGDVDGWRTGDLQEVLRLAREAGVPESYVQQMGANVPEYLAQHPNVEAWVNRQVMLAFATMMWTAESLGYDTAPMEGFDDSKVRSALKLPMSYFPVAMLAIGRAKSTQAQYKVGRFSQSRTLFGEEYPSPYKG